MSEGDDFSKGYIKGFKEGLLESWNELVKLASRGYTTRELKIMLQNSRSALNDRVEQKKMEIEKALGREIFGEASTASSAGGITNLSPGMSICFREDQPVKGLELIIELLADGHELLSISRKHPEKLMQKLGHQDKMIWLTKSEEGISDLEIKFVSPTNLPVLAEEIRSFLDEKEGGQIFLEGIEYLCTQNDFKSVLKFTQLVNEQVLLKKGYLILSANPSTMDPREFSLIEREMSQVA